MPVTAVMQSLPEPSTSTPADLNPTLGAVFIGTMLGLVSVIRFPDP